MDTYQVQELGILGLHAHLLEVQDSQLALM